jgi:hypothetical protein
MIRRDGFDFSKADLQKTNHIVVNTRIAMYSLQIIFTPIQGGKFKEFCLFYNILAVCAAGILYILYKNMRSINDNQVLKGYFFSKPIGHQVCKKK